MTTASSYRDKYRKDAKLEASFSATAKGNFTPEQKDRYQHWITFFRRNPIRFIQDYLGIKLFPYQFFMIHALNKTNICYIVAARGTAKSWIIAVWAATLCILYPGTKVKIVASTISQGGIILGEKLRSLMDDHPMLRREIKKITTDANAYEAVFNCGSTIKVVPSSDSARGGRANYVIVEESRLVEKEVLEGIIKPFMTVRIPPFRLKPEYANDPLLKEEPKISYITSSYYTSGYWYREYVRKIINRILHGDTTVSFLAFDYSVCLFHNIKTEAGLKNEMESMDEATVDMEYRNLPSDVGGKAYFKMNFFKRSMRHATYPQIIETFNPKKNPFRVDKVPEELRILGVDIATRANKENDNTIIAATRLIPNKGKGYERKLSYMESFKGVNTILQARRIKEIFFDLEADYLVIDLKNAGVAVFDSLTQITSDEERGIDYPAMTIVDESYPIEEKLREDLTNRTLGANPLKVIFPIIATAQLNSQIAVAFRTTLQKKLWQFLDLDSNAEEFLLKDYHALLTDDGTLRAFLLNPFVQCGLLLSECLNLNMSIQAGGYIKLDETPGSHKDRYTATSYLNWVVSEYFDPVIRGEKEDTQDEWDVLLSLTSFL
jgi:hypothetical protein